MRQKRAMLLSMDSSPKGRGSLAAFPKKRGRKVKRRRRKAKPLFGFKRKPLGSLYSAIKQRLKKKPVSIYDQYRESDERIV